MFYSPNICPQQECTHCVILKSDKLCQFQPRSKEKLLGNRYAGCSEQKVTLPVFSSLYTGAGPDLAAPCLIIAWCDLEGGGGVKK